MQKKVNIRLLLGLTHEEIALLLKVSRSQWSMYELGKRDLPTAAKLQLADMLQHVQENQKQRVQNLPQLKKQEDEKKKVVAELVLINQHHQVSLEKKIKALQKKQEANFAKIRMAGYLENQDLKKRHPRTSSIKKYRSKGTNGFSTNGFGTAISIPN